MSQKEALEDVMARRDTEDIQTDSKTMRWGGWISSGLVVLFLLVDGVVKVLQLAPAVEGTVRLGYPAEVVVWLGVVLLVCTILYIIPRTSVLGAILLTGYLGGATATQIRVENPWFLFPVVLGVLLWGGLFVREERLRTLIPVRNLPLSPR